MNVHLYFTPGGGKINPDPLIKLTKGGSNFCAKPEPPHDKLGESALVRERLKSWRKLGRYRPTLKINKRIPTLSRGITRNASFN